MILRNRYIIFNTSLLYMVFDNKCCNVFRFHFLDVFMELVFFSLSVNSFGRSYIQKGKGNFFRYRPGVAQRVGWGIALLFHDRGTRRGWVVSSTPRPHFTPGKLQQWRYYIRESGPLPRWLTTVGRSPEALMCSYTSNRQSEVASRSGLLSLHVWCTYFLNI